MNFHSAKYYRYVLKYYFLPGKWMTSQDLLVLRNCLQSVNSSSGRNFSYGIFDKSLTPDEQKDFFDNINLCIIEEDNQAIGFFYNLVLCETPTPIIHAGLVV